ncbi:hypothetical protein STEG23_019658, partial [Scotinomys teguina]
NKMGQLRTRIFCEETSQEKKMTFGNFSEMENKGKLRSQHRQTLTTSAFSLHGDKGADVQSWCVPQTQILFYADDALNPEDTVSSVSISLEKILKMQVKPTE